MCYTEKLTQARVCISENVVSGPRGNFCGERAEVKFKIFKDVKIKNGFSTFLNKLFMETVKPSNTQ
jgi:hypothetical protein